MTSRRGARARQPLGHRLGPRQLTCFLATAVVLAVLLMWGSDASTQPVAAVARLTLLAAGGTVGLCAWSQPNGVWSCSAAYLITLTLFHFGLAALIVLHGPLAATDGQLDFTWIYSFNMSRVFALAALGVVAAALGASLPALVTTAVWGPESRPRRYRRQRRVARDRRRVVIGPDPDPRPAPAGVAGRVGLVILVGAVAQFVITIVRAGGIGLLFGSYGDLISLVYGNSSVPYLDFALGLGLVLLVGSGPSRLCTAGLVLFAAFAAFALPLGMRGTIMFPALAATAIAARRRWMVPGAVALLAGVALLGAIGALREVRQVGLAGVQLRSLAFSPVDGLAELGASIRPLTEVVYWRDQLGEPAARGRTYTGQATRLVKGRLLGEPQPPSTTDERLFNTVIMKRVGPIGGSPVAEAYYNFGPTGVAAVMFCIGLICGWLDTGRPPVATDACRVVVLAPLLIGVRNDFTPLPFQVVAGGLVLAGVHLLERLPPRPRVAPVAVR